MEVETENKVFKLGEIFRITSGGTPSRNNPKYYDGDIPWIKTGDLKVRHLFKASEFITKEGLENSSAKIFPKNTVLIAMYGATIGACSILKIDAATNQACAAFLPTENVNPEFLYFYLQSIKPKLVAQGVGGGQPNISGGILKQTEIALPEIEEQNEIVRILEQADAARQKRKQALALTEQFLQSAFLEMFNDNQAKKGKWKEVFVNDIAARKKGAMRTGPFGSNLLHSEFVDEGIPVLGIDNAVMNRFQWAERRFITREKYEELKNYTVYPRDVIVTIMATVGRSAVIPDIFPIATNTKHLAAITVDESLVNPYFLSFSFYSHPRFLSHIENYLRGAIMPGLNLGIIKQIKFPLPPLALQEEFAALVERVEQLRHKQRESEKELENLFGSLMGRWFG